MALFCGLPATGNPPGYGSEHLAHVGRLFVDVDMGGLVRSLGHRPLSGFGGWTHPPGRDGDGSLKKDLKRLKHKSR